MGSIIAIIWLKDQIQEE